MNENIKSGADYAKLIIETIESANEPNEMARGVMPYWFNLIREAADHNWELYITGKRDTYMFSDNEVAKMWETAGLMFVQDEVNNLIDKGVLEASVDANGDILYGLTEEGKKLM